MLVVRAGSVVVLLSAALSGCASCPPCEAKSAGAAKAETCKADPEPAALPGPEPGAATPAATAAAPAPSAPAPSPEASPAPAPAGSLPEVKVENVGLHIGGGPNDDAAKAPFLRAIEKQFDAFRSCYTKVDDPVKGGTFGVDLHIGRDGGHAQVKQPRTGMKGQGFRDCVVKVFEQVEFEKPKKGPTVISYSIKYTLGK